MLVVEGTLSSLAPPDRNEKACSLEKGRPHSQQEKRPRGQEAKAERPSLGLGAEAERREDHEAVRAGPVPGAWRRAGTADAKTWAAGSLCAAGFQGERRQWIPPGPQTKQGEGEDRRGRGRLPWLRGQGAALGAPPGVPSGGWTGGGFPSSLRSALLSLTTSTTSTISLRHTKPGSAFCSS